MMLSEEERQTYIGVFEYQKRQAEVVPIDANMRTLVFTLNRLPGIATEACCGGHEHPIDHTQRPAGEWFVTFQAYQLDERGWYDLEIIRYAMDAFKGKVTLEFAAPTSSFSLTGKEVKPDAFATAVFRERQRRLHPRPRDEVDAAADAAMNDINDLFSRDPDRTRAVLARFAARRAAREAQDQR